MQGRYRDAFLPEDGENLSFLLRIFFYLWLLREQRANGAISVLQIWREGWGRQLLPTVVVK